MADFRDVRLRYHDRLQTIGGDGYPSSEEEDRRVSTDWPLPVQLLDIEGRGPYQVFANLYKNITGQTTNIIKSGPGYLHAITFNKPIATSVVTLYDNDGVDASTIIGTITIPASPMLNYFLYDIAFSRGLTVVQGTASSDITVIYQ